MNRFIWNLGLLGILSLCFGLIESSDIQYVKEKPSFIKTCKVFEPQFTKCSTESVQKLLTMITNEPGIPEVKKVVGTLDPLHLDKLYFKQENTDAANLKATLTDLLATGLAKMEVKESKVSKKDFSWLTKLYIPKFKLDGHYKMDGRILLLPLNGEGHMEIEIEGLNILLHTKTKLFDEGGFTFYNVTQVRAELDITHLRTKFENLFGGNNKEIEDSTNESFNKNWREFFEALRPLVTDTVEKIMYDIMHKVFLIYPANFFVSDIPTAEKLYGKSQ